MEGANKKLLDRAIDEMIEYIQARYPNLTGLAQQEVYNINQPEKRALLFQKLVAVSDEKAVRALIELAADKQ